MKGKVIWSIPWQGVRSKVRKSDPGHDVKIDRSKITQINERVCGERHGQNLGSNVKRSGPCLEVKAKGKNVITNVTRSDLRSHIKYKVMRSITKS